MVRLAQARLRGSSRGRKSLLRHPQAGLHPLLKVAMAAVSALQLGQAWLGGGLEAAAQVGAGEARASDESTGSEGSGSDDDSDSGSDSDGDSVGGPRDKSGLKDARKVSRPGQTYVLNSMNYLYIQYRGPGTGDLTGLVLRCLGPGLTVLVLGPG